MRAPLRSALLDVLRQAQPCCGPLPVLLPPPLSPAFSSLAPLRHCALLLRRPFFPRQLSPRVASWPHPQLGLWLQLRLALVHRCVFPPVHRKKRCSCHTGDGTLQNRADPSTP